MKTSYKNHLIIENALQSEMNVENALEMRFKQKKHLAEAIKAERKRIGYSQREVGEILASRLISPSTIFSVENPRKEVQSSIQTAIKVLQILEKEPSK